MKKLIRLSVTFLIVTLPVIAQAQIPRTISYQGVLADAAGNPKPNGDYSFTFKFYETSNGGNAIWSETKTLAVKRGLFSTALGEQTVFGPEVKFDKPYWLGIQVGNDAELPHRVALSSAAYSFNSLKAEVAANVADGQVVKSINTLKDVVTIEGAGGATVTAAGSKITISAAGGNGTGIQGIQNTDNTLTITNPNGPTATVNLKVPLKLSGKLEIAGQDALAISGYQPLMIFHDANAAGARGVIQSVSGGLNLFAESYMSGANPFAYLTLNNSGNVGIGSAQPVSKLEIVGQDALALIGYQPLLTFRDTNAGYARGRIQSVSGGLNLFAESYMSGANPFAYLTLNNSGNVGIGSATPVGKLEVVAQDALRLVGYQPFLTILDVNAGYARSRIQGAGGDLVLETEAFIASGNPAVGSMIIKSGSGNVGVGIGNPQTRLDVNGTTRTKVLAVVGGSDLAEPFETEDGHGLESGTVMVIDAEHPGKLVVSASAYDRKVAGIVSGAGGVKAGITLQQDGVMEGNALIAIAGRVYCKAEADSAPIQPGDLLTTSNIPGHAMKATDDNHSHGAIIGKAMSTLQNGKGLVLVLVNLQ